MDLRPQDRSALELAAELVDSISPGQLDLPTPCGPWRLDDLLRHMVSQNKRFAAAALGTDLDAAAPLEGGELDGGPAAAFRASVREVTAGFAADGPADRTVVMPELPGPMPVSAAVGFHFTDFLVHGWDVARALGAPFAPPAELTRAALALAERIPDGARRPGGPFGPIAETGPDADPFDRLLGLTGRHPDWKAAGG